MAETRPSPPLPVARLSIGVTGHRASHAGFDANQQSIRATMAAVMACIDDAVARVQARGAGAQTAPTRLHCLLADGTDSVAADIALERGYELVAPLPFGRRLNKAINAHPRDAAEARALLAGEDASHPETRRHADTIRRLSDAAHIFALAECDAHISTLFLAKLDTPEDISKAQLFTAEASRRVALAGRVLIEQSDIIIAVWDGVSSAHVGGTGHTIAAALDHSAPVIWIDPAQPDSWRLLVAPESLAERRAMSEAERTAAIEQFVATALHPPEQDDHPGLSALAHERWRPRSSRLSHAYRRVETLFGGKSDRSRLRGLTVHYEDPAAISGGAAAELLNTARGLPAADPDLGERVTREIVQRFAWFDGVSAYLSDAYRGGMIISFILSSLAIVGGIAYLPFVGAEQKWMFALFELVLLVTILIITAVGQRKRWHSRWFETRRVAEYLRHAPLLVTLGAARARGRWPQGAATSWPEYYVRHALRAIGLPRMAVTSAYLRGLLSGVIGEHVTSQRDYHFAKAQRLETVHRNLDHLSERLFQLAVASVALYLLLRLAPAFGMMGDEEASHISKYFTVLGVLFPTFGAGVAGIRYFGDFERFAAISEVTAEKLDVVHDRIALLLAAPDAAIDYGAVAELAHATDDIVFAEIENWQAVFGGKQISVPV